MPFTDVKIQRADGSRAAVGEVAELYVRSPSVSPGYWQRPESNAETFVDGWCKTGDLASVDAEGFITLGGRAKDMIRSGGENIYPAEVEAVLTTAPGVADAAVVGVPDAKFHEVGCAILIPIDGHWQAEAPKSNPQYYYRPWKTILVRTVADGGESFYVCGDHRQTLPHLRQAAIGAPPP